MNWSRWERLAPLTGVLAVALWILGAILITSNEPGEDATANESLAFLRDEGPIYGASWAWGLGTLFFIWFLGSLRARLAAAEGPPNRLTAIAFGSGIAAAVCALGVVVGPLSGAFLDDKTMTAAAAQALDASTDSFLILGSFPLLAMAAATAIAAFRYGALPKWLAWLTVVFAIILAVYPIAWLAILFAFPIWILMTSISLWRPQLSAPR
jgi:hypothetical protein